jgi:hypothetical protein
VCRPGRPERGKDAPAYRTPYFAPALRTPHFEPRTPDIARGYHQRMLQAQVTAFFLFDVADSINLTMLAGIE